MTATNNIEQHFGMRQKRSKEKIIKESSSVTIEPGSSSTSTESSTTTTLWNINDNNNRSDGINKPWRKLSLYILYVVLIAWLGIIFFITNDNVNIVSSVNQIECKQQDIGNNNNNNDDDDDYPIQIILPQHYHQKQQQQQEIQDQFQRLPSFEEFNSNIRFVFTIGLEGTGHHLLKSLTKHVPYVKALTPEFQYDRISDMASSIYKSTHTRQGLLSAFCDYDNTNNSSVTEPLPNEHELLYTLVQKIQHANEQVESGASVPLPTSHNDNTTTTIKVKLPITVPLNSYRMTFQSFGMMSYPNFMYACRNLNYPNLDLLYRACTIAKVDCGHLYMYRDPYSIIKSTSINRLFNKSPLSAIQLYIAHLSIIYTQLKIHSARTIGCVEFYDTANHATVEEIMDPIYKIFGWKEYPFNYTETINHLYRPPPPVSMEEQRHVVPPQYQVYMKSMEKLSTSIINLCREQANENKFI